MKVNAELRQNLTVELIKEEPEVELSTESSNIFDCDISQHCVEPEVNLEVEYLPHFNEEVSSPTFTCKNELGDSLTREETVLNSEMAIEDILHQENPVYEYVCNLKQILMQNKNTPDSRNINYEVKEFATHNFLVKEENIKEEQDEWDIPEDPLQLPETNSFTLQAIEHKHENVQEFAENSDDDNKKIGISERTLQPNKYNEIELIKHESDAEEQRTFEARHNDTYRCDRCSYQSTNRHLFRRHISIIHSEYRPKLNCHLCDKTFLGKQTLDDHLLKLHKNEINVKDLITNKIHTCKICGYETTRKSSLNKHINSMHTEQKFTINCQFCDKSLTTKFSLHNHLLSQHDNEIKNNIKDFVTSKIHACEFCSYKTTLKAFLKTHVSSVHSKENLTCEFCDKSFMKGLPFDKHVLKHHEKEIKKKIHQCHTCSYKTIYKYRFDRHINSMHTEHLTKFICELCLKLFTRKRTLDEHIRKHHKNEVKAKEFITSTMHTCEFCFYETTRKTDLTHHVKSIHNGQKINCQFCDKSFTRKYVLHDHLLKQHFGRIKDDMKSFVTSKIHTCTICSYKTTNKTVLTGHIHARHKL